jgi:hypothetical protein
VVNLRSDLTDGHGAVSINSSNLLRWQFKIPKSADALSKVRRGGASPPFKLLMARFPWRIASRTKRVDLASRVALEASAMGPPT